MKKLTLAILMLTLLLPVGSIPSFAQSTEQEIQELKRMVEQNSKQNGKTHFRFWIMALSS